MAEDLLIHTGTEEEQYQALIPLIKGLLEFMQLYDAPLAQRRMKEIA